MTYSSSSFKWYQWQQNRVEPVHVIFTSPLTASDTSLLYVLLEAAAAAFSINKFWYLSINILKRSTARLNAVDHLIINITPVSSSL
jgi:hypothetical protein